MHGFEQSRLQEEVTKIRGLRTSPTYAVKDSFKGQLLLVEMRMIK
jgi:hypothetical protein